jgi:hypothetical protein
VSCRRLEKSKSKEVDVTVQEDTQPFATVRPYDEQPRRGCGCGCWLPALITLFLVIALVVVGAVLPPINLAQRLFGLSLFGPNYVMLSAQANAVPSVDGALTLAVKPDDPGKDFGIAVNPVSIEDFTTGNAQVADWIPSALASLPPNLALKSAVYNVQTTGAAPSSGVTLIVNLPPTAGNTDVLDLYAWDKTSGQWRFVAAHPGAAGTLNAALEAVPSHLALFQAAPLGQPTVLAAVDATQKLPPEVGQVSTVVAPGGMQPTIEGKLTGSLAPGFELNRGYLVMPAIRNFTDPRALDLDTVSAILRNSALRGEHVRQIVGFAANNNFAGVMIDYRGLANDLRPNFSAFITELGKAMETRSLALGVVVPAAQNANGAWETGAYDWRALGGAARYVQINLNPNPTDFAAGADKPVESMLRWAVGEVSRYKLLIGLSALSVQQAGESFAAVGYQEALAALGNVKVEAEKTQTGSINPGAPVRASLDGFKAVSGMDTVAGSPFIEYASKDGGKAGRVWLTTPAALRFRMDKTALFGLGGVAFEDVLAPGVADGILQAILNYKLQAPEKAPADELALRWRIESKSGVIAEKTTGLNEPLVATISAPDGNYAINVEVVGGGGQLPRNGAAVALFAPTPTPTPVPTATPTPVPTATPTPVPIKPTAIPVPSGGGGGAAVRPGAGSIAVGNFEYGGHVTSTASDGAAAAMKRAGMNWMKIQIRYGVGNTAGSVAEAINAAHARGFKVLLGIVGSPGELAAGGDGYVGQYAQFLGGVAGLGPDAIEVWNEMNLDREWPRGQISAAAYTNMLRQAYQAIKGANSGVLVISGAPAPTGAEAAFPGQVVNDDRYIREMVAAGALQYMDCLGAHYNEGIVAPNQRSGDPRDGYYTRYFFGMLDTYWNLIGGQKPICFTELGYLSPEGFGPLPGFFAWAQNVTVAQQSAWLAQAAALSSQSGKVRLMIVWNVDFDRYDSDPMAGYAMIRPGGGCPACDALAGAR